jgi:carboxymethylenebutenolidase
MPEITVPGGASTPALDAFLAVPPSTPGPWPGVVVVHEIFGLNDDVRDHALRLAAAGYLTAAVDLFSAGGARRCIRAVMRALSNGEGPAVEDILAARSWLAGHADCTGKVGVIGFCMGGGFALLTAARGFDAAAPNYAFLPAADDAFHGACPIVASYGERDRELRGAAAKLEARLDAAGVVHDVKEYPGAGHSFLNRPNLGPAAPVLRVAGIGYHAPSAEDAWGRILRFFGEHLR